MNIALCDDIPDILDNLKTYLEDYSKDNNIKLNIDCFDCGEAFLHCEKHYDIVFMDIYLGKISGMETIRNYRNSRSSQIVFITTSLDHAIEAFGLNATHYLVKPLTQKAVSEAMDRCLTRLELKSNKFIEVKTIGGMRPIPLENIIYIEVFNKVSVIHNKVNDIQTYTSLDALFKLLGDGCFMRAQRSYIVNMKFIDTFFFDRIVLEGGTEIILSRNNRGKLKKQYQQYLFNLARRGQL